MATTLLEAAPATEVENELDLTIELLPELPSIDVNMGRYCSCECW
ncbi:MULTISPECIES: hypothetical protein [Streptomycetaceae]|uniref:Uncharacterized protein n=1 Tax=Kitasatospora purpeofusca TaxID=67352 RepID=A0ABZ1U486_9ACTN|nr:MULTISPECIES: hypothetical protein [Streptomycetaceae]MCX4753384.1 hypothetical protein [Kitasatospora purpeofusca]WSR32889.1 hypothetical protein OG715_19005 [Kitasatospora purpeofusca]WSR40982.1 hypothetical protein OG196_18820 [Kitasatospora purpeofusca]